MKTLLVLALVSFVALDSLAQSTSQQARSIQSKDTPYAIKQNDANSRVWERTTYEQLPSGEMIPHVHRYEEAATGLNFKNPDTGQWEESSEVIEQISGGAVARHGQHKIIFASDLATFGAIDMEMPDGQRLRSHLIGLSYFDRASGQSVLIAEVTNSIGQVIAPNQIWYENAFSGVKAAVRYTYTREGFEQDVILEEQPPTPEVYGLRSSTTVLQVLTEFISPPTPAISMTLVTATPGDQLVDETLSFNAMKIGRGRAFSMGNSSKGTPVVKEWATMEGRQFLIEEVPVSQITGDLQALPPSQATTAHSNSVVNIVSLKRLLPPQPLAKASTKQMRIASLPALKSGFVLDYASLNTGQTNYTFRTDTTYFLSGNVNLFGTNTTFECATVLKYASNVSLTVNTPITWQASAYRPVVMVSQDDDTVAEPISGSTGNPGNNYYAAKALYFDGTAAATNLNIDSLRILNAQAGIVINGQSNHVVNNLQLLKCGFGIAATNTDVSVRNALFGNVVTNFTGTNVTVRVEQLTSSAATWLNKDIGSNLFLTNCLLVGVTNLGNCSTQNVAVLSITNTVFQTVGGGSYYLATNSPYRDAGTTNINSNLLAALKQKTTYPPMVYSNANINAVTTFNPTAARDVDVPDLGFHYDPLDWAFAGVTVNSNITFAAGTAVGWYLGSSDSFALSLANKQITTFAGTFENPDNYVRCSTVQEGGNGNWIRGSGTIGLIGTADQNLQDVTLSPELRMRFTSCSVLAQAEVMFRDYAGYLIVRANHCRLTGGNQGGYIISYYMTNCLIDGGQIGTVAGWTGNEMYLRNCTLREDLLYLSRYHSPPMMVNFRDCAFDGITQYTNGDSFITNTSCSVFDYNAYTNAANLFPVGCAHDKKSVVFNWQTGPLGRFYLPSNSVLTNAGDVTADVPGLYHFTTQTNQVKETNSVVDIGYHYVALDSLGNAVDTDGDGVPDYKEDANGNGVYDAGDPSNWREAPIIIGEAARTSVPSSAKFHAEIGDQPDDGSVQQLNPPVFTWLYYEDPSLYAEYAYYDIRGFHLQLATNNSFSSLTWDVVCSNNFYNLLPPITNSDGSSYLGTNYWRIIYANSNSSVMATGIVHNFTLASSARKWDRRFLADTNYMATATANHPHLFFNSSNRDVMSKFVQTNTWITPGVYYLSYTNDAYNLITNSWWNSDSLTNENDWEQEASEFAKVGFLYQMTTNAVMSNAAPGLMLEIYATNLVKYGLDRSSAYNLNANTPQYLSMCYDWLYPLMTTQQRSNVLYCMESMAQFYVYEDWLFTKTAPNLNRVYTNTLYATGGSQLREGESHSRNSQVGLTLCMAGMGDSEKLRNVFPYYLSYYYSVFDPFQGDDGRAYNSVQDFEVARQFGPMLMAAESFPAWGMTNAPIYTNLLGIFSFLEPVGYGGGQEIEPFCWGVQGGDPKIYKSQWQYTRFYDAACLFNSGSSMRQFNRSTAFTGVTSDSPLMEIFTPFYFPPPVETDASSTEYLDLVHGWAMSCSQLPTDYGSFTNGVGFIFQARASAAGRINATFTDGQVEAWAYGAHLTSGGSGNYEEHTMFQNNSLFVDGVGLNNMNPPVSDPVLAAITAFTNTTDYTYVCADLTKAFNRTNWFSQGYQDIETGFYFQETNARPYISGVTRSVLFPHKKYFVIYDQLQTSQPAHFQWKWNVWSPTAVVNTNDCSFVYTCTNNYHSTNGGNDTNVTVYVVHATDPTAMSLTNMMTGSNLLGDDSRNLAKINPYSGENYGPGSDPQGTDHSFPYWADSIWVQNKVATTNWHFMSVVFPVKWDDVDGAPTITRISDSTVHVVHGAIDDVISFNETNTSPGSTFIVKVPPLLDPTLGTNSGVGDEGVSNYHLEFHTSACGTDGSDSVTDGTNTAGSTIIFILASKGNSVSDSYGNTWTPITPCWSSASAFNVQWFYCVNPTVGAGHTFTQNHINNTGNIAVMGFSGNAVSPFDTNSCGGSGNWAGPGGIQPGSITPANITGLMILGLGFDESLTTSVNSGFVQVEAPATDPRGNGMRMYYKYQNNRAVEHPRITETGAGNPDGDVEMGAFK